MYIPRHIRLFFAPDIVWYLEEGKFPQVMQKVSILADFLHTKIQTKILCWNFRMVYGARNRVGIGLLYHPARIHRLAESIPWNRFWGSLKV